MRLEEEDFLVPVVVLADTGLETNLIDEHFARKHGLTLIKRETPLICTGYDGNKGLEIVWEWRGQVRDVGQDGHDESFEIALQVTFLREQDGIIGCPWMQEVGCEFELGRGRSYLKLGTQLIVTCLEQTKLSDTYICKINLPVSDSLNHYLPISNTRQSKKIRT